MPRQEITHHVDGAEGIPETENSKNCHLPSIWWGKNFKLQKSFIFPRPISMNVTNDVCGLSATADGQRLKTGKEGTEGWKEVKRGKVTKRGGWKKKKRMKMETGR